MMPDFGPRNTKESATEIATGVTVCWPSSRCSDGSKLLSMSVADLGGGVYGVIEKTELGLGKSTESLDECKWPRNSDPQLRSVQLPCAVLEDACKVKPIVDLFPSTRGLHRLHLNTRSLLPKITEIHLLSNSNEVGLFYFTETWLDDYIKDVKHSAASWSMLRPPDQIMFYKILEEVLKVYGLCQFGSYHDRRF